MSPLPFVCLGTVNFGTLISHHESFAILDNYVELGGSWIDTANVYADWHGLGIRQSESVIGKWIRSRKHPLKLCTKVGLVHKHSGYSVSLTPKYVENEVDLSLITLNCDTIEILWFHRFDPNADLIALREVVEKLVEKGKIKTIGVSNWSINQISSYESIEGSSISRISSVQYMWSLVQLDGVGLVNAQQEGLLQMDSEIFDFCRQQKHEIFAYRILGAGYIGAKTRKRTHPELRRIANDYSNDRNLMMLKRLDILSRNLGIEVPTLVVAYLVNYNVVPIIGPTKQHHVKTLFQGVNLELKNKELEWLIGTYTNQI